LKIYFIIILNLIFTILLNKEEYNSILYGNKIIVVIIFLMI